MVVVDAVVVVAVAVAASALQEMLLAWEVCVMVLVVVLWDSDVASLLSSLMSSPAPSMDCSVGCGGNGVCCAVYVVDNGGLRD